MAILFLLLLLLLPFSSPALSARCNPQDKKALLQIKKDLKNPYLLASWTPDSDCCEWYCVKCDFTTHRIRSLSLANDGVSFQIPPAIGDLPYLDTLDLHKLPNLTGPIHPAIAKLTRLVFLGISWTSVSGPVPDFLPRLTHLKSLYLPFNKLSGYIPPSLSQLHNLNEIDLSRNKLTGPIPYTFGYFKNSPTLYLSRNQLSGKIPASLGKLNSSSIDLSRNKLQGDASMLFGPNKLGLHMLDLSRNLLEFDLSKVNVPESMTWLDLNHNRIYGRLPVGLEALQLQKLDVSYNLLCGPIPAGGSLQKMGKDSYMHNKCLCGSPLPRCK
ncbi:polygalacturonase inhibitor-like [Prosopis cineraria]|uniref:polygalacturonase inhibitor-like n=1 Tax=Prosopis cineraria TaxID=364024 RepID=UPI00240FF687|nr:polygalacturonase inhibitor-like [Prosopis cineraria]